MIKRIIICISFLVLLVYFVVCDNKTTEPVTEPVYDTTHSSLQSNLERNLEPQAEQSAIEELVSGNSTFAFNLFNILNEQGTSTDNIFFSPYSISLAFALLYPGAVGDTKTEISEVLNYSLPDETHHNTFNYLDLELESRGEGAAGMDDGGFRLNIDNSIWYQLNYPVEQNYLDTLAFNYGAGLFTVDFMSNPEGSRQAINLWVEENTEGLIEELLGSGSISSYTRLVLVNTIYYNAGWCSLFEEDDTEAKEFFLLNGETKQVEMMTQNMMMSCFSFSYEHSSEYIAVEMFYDGGELSMIAIMPAAGTFAQFAASFDLTKYNEIVSEMTSFKDQYTDSDLAELGINVFITIPKWKDHYKKSLAEALNNMGMEKIFNGGDFSNICSGEALEVSDVIHEAVIDVNEKGTEAAAATAITVGIAGVFPSLHLTFDHPYFYFIRDVATDTILFMGQMTDPAYEE